LEDSRLEFQAIRVHLCSSVANDDALTRPGVVAVQSSKIKRPPACVLEVVLPVGLEPTLPWGNLILRQVEPIHLMVDMPALLMAQRPLEGTLAKLVVPLATICRHMLKQGSTRHLHPSPASGGGMSA
jgi:hypothetical protein